ncbi:hypothetical protein F5Y19DRAFT_408276 [Xylariaceae sp. FL1651]|nr:hypothetical protein F5Y19DRAFT_408276 [Xylariaceae sp. FL1651]
MNTTNISVPDYSAGRVVPASEPTDDLSHDNFGPSVEACVWALTVLAAGWLSLRIYLKSRNHRGLWWDDHILNLSFVCLTLANSSTSIAISLGWGKEPYDIPPKNSSLLLLALYISGSFSLAAAALSKTSFALTLLRISNGWVRFAIWFIIITINVVLGLSAVFNWVQCTPVEKNFDIFIPGTCWRRETLIGYSAFGAAYSGFMDIVLAVLPWKIIWKMNMSRKERVGAICAMSLGVFAGIVSLVKICAIIGTIRENIDSSVQLTVLAAAETAITIMAASIPILRALARDTSGPRGIKLFTLNTTQHLTLQRQSDSQLITVDDAPGKSSETPRRLFKIVRKASDRRKPVLSKIVETDELSPGLFGEATPRERSFV